LDRAAITRLARGLTDLLDAARSDLAAGPPSALISALSDHLGVDVREATIVSHHWAPWEHVSVHRGITAHLEAVTPGAQWIGLPGGPMRMHNDLPSVLRMDSSSDRLASADYVLLPTSPTQTQDVVANGLVRTADGAGSPVVLALRETQMTGPPQITVDVIAADRVVASGALSRLQARVGEHDILRGQVLSFSANEHQGNQMVSFLPRPSVSASDVILPPDVLPTIEQHVSGPAEQAQRLSRLGIHLKRGVLLHGPPGTGKTHTVRHLMGRLAHSTVLVLTGNGLMYIDQAAALARRLAPSVVVVEDVDLIAQDRSFSPMGNPLLFSLLDAMDGVAADADVTFVLTTNRATMLEEALVQRPGRIDLAVEIPRPDADGRRRLAELYRGRATVTADLEPLIAVTEGATASAIKELMRRAVLRALDADVVAASPIVDDAVLTAVLADFVSETQSLSRSLLGAGADGGAEASGAQDALLGERFVATAGPDAGFIAPTFVHRSNPTGFGGWSAG
jgi:energy-coupling factor transporter ATP-binding protein EcfA2